MSESIKNLSSFLNILFGLHMPLALLLISYDFYLVSITPHPLHLFWIVVCLSSFIVGIILTVCGNANCKCCCYCVKFNKRVRKKRTEKRHNGRKCSTCMNLPRYIGERLATYEDQELSRYNIYKTLTETQVCLTYIDEM